MPTVRDLLELEYNGRRPVGSHTTNSSLSAAVTITIPTGANKLMWLALAKNIRFTLDGTTPTANVGFRLGYQYNTSPMVISVSPAMTIKVIEEAASATLDYQFFR